MLLKIFIYLLLLPDGTQLCLIFVRSYTNCSPERCLEMDSLNISSIVLNLLAMIIIIPVHEFCHAAMAVKLGDDTPVKENRYTLNPISHISPLGTIAFLIFGFGWGRAVRVNYSNLKKPRRDSAIIAAMGPLSNIALAALFLAVEKILLAQITDIRMISRNMDIICYVLDWLVSMNIMLFIINLLPFPPLDGAKILEAFLPIRFYQFIKRYESVFSVLFLLVLYTGALNIPMYFLSSHITAFLNFVTRPIDLLFA